MTPILSLNGVRFVRNRRAILDDVSWTVQPGEHWALLGANGSGKTTLLKILTGYEWASEGTVHVLGERFGDTDVRALRKHVGWVSSSIEHRLHAEDTAIEIVLSGLDASLGLYRQFAETEKQAAHHALASVGGEALTQKRYGVLSQGEQQRVLIARALVARPSILVLDEPCAGLDPSARHAFLKDLRLLSASRSAPALVLVTHHIEEIGDWINRVLVLKQGKILAQGAPSEVMTDAVLSAAFSAQCHVHCVAGEYRLQVNHS